MLIFSLPIPPTINHYYCHRKGGFSKYLSAEANQFRQMVYYAYIGLKNRISFNNKENLQINIKFTFNNNRANDIDNRIKPLLDALTHAGVFLDDKYIVKMIVEKHVDKSLKEGICEVELFDVSCTQNAKICT